MLIVNETFISSTAILTSVCRPNISECTSYYLHTRYDLILHTIKPFLYCYYHSTDLQITIPISLQPVFAGNIFSRVTLIMWWHSIF